VWVAPEREPPFALERAASRQRRRVLVGESRASMLGQSKPGNRMMGWWSKGWPAR
jgi:hypothetical protein